MYKEVLDEVLIKRTAFRIYSIYHFQLCLKTGKEQDVSPSQKRHVKRPLPVSKVNDKCIFNKTFSNWEWFEPLQGVIHNFITDNYHNRSHGVRRCASSKEDKRSLKVKRVPQGHLREGCPISLLYMSLT